jgi:hypothetical protein
MPQWNHTERGQIRDDPFTTSYGTQDADSDWDGKSCADYEQLPQRGPRDVESLTMLSGLAEYDSDEIPDES